MLKPLVLGSIVAFTLGGFWWHRNSRAAEHPAEAAQRAESEAQESAGPVPADSSNRSALPTGPGSTEQGTAQLLELDRLLQAHAMSHDGVFPARLEDLEADPAVASFNDPWQRPLHYQAPGHRVPYQLYSLGADGQPGGTGEDRDLFLGDLKQD